MNTSNLKKLGSLAILLAGTGVLSPAYAWTSTGVQLLGAAANAVDTWTFSCPITHPRARAQVNDIVPANNPAVLSVVLGRKQPDFPNNGF